MSGPNEPLVFVCAGGGGVGKTTTSAALALALARTGKRTLVVTVDPARRLASAMGVAIDADVHSVHIDDPAHGNLFALMPEPRQSTRSFVELLFENEPRSLERMLQNRIYGSLVDGLAGIHDLVALMLVARAVEAEHYDALVIDTAPSRYALDFISYPGRLAELFEGRAVGFFAALAARARDDEGHPAPKDEGGLVAWGKQRIEAAIGRILDPAVLLDLAGLFAELSLVRDRFATLARSSERLLLGEATRYLLVTAPTGAAEADLAYVVGKLDRLRQRPHAVLLNRADEAPARWLEELGRARDGLTLPVQQAVQTLLDEAAARKRAGDRAARDIAKHHTKATAIRLPNVEARDPTAIVHALADRLGEELGRLA